MPTRDKDEKTNFHNHEHFFLILYFKAQRT